MRDIETDSSARASERYWKSKRKGESHSFTTAEREVILSEATDDILLLSKEVQDKYVSFELATRRMNEHPDRFFVFIDKRGETQTVDLKAVNIKGSILVKGGTQEDVRDAEEIKKEIFRPILREYSARKFSFESAYKKESKGGMSLGPDVVERIIDLFGQMYGVNDVIKIVKEECNIYLSNKELLRFYATKKAQIDIVKTKFLKNSQDYRIATEAGRLQILNSILTDLHIRYEKHLTAGREDKALIFEREIRNILEQARKEVKGNELKLTVDGKIDITATLHGTENVSRVMRSLPINSIIIGIVAAKSNLDPGVLIGQLATSYYKDVNGFNKNILGREKIELPGDIIRNCDWRELSQQNQNFLEEMRGFEVEEATFEEMVKKETVLEKLKRLRDVTK